MTWNFIRWSQREARHDPCVREIVREQLELVCNAPLRTPGCNAGGRGFTKTLEDLEFMFGRNLSWMMWLVCLLLPVAMWADTTTPVPAGSTIDLNSGNVAASGGDVGWSGTSLTYQGLAKGYNEGQLSIGYAALSPAIATGLTSFATTVPVPAAQLGVGAVIAVYTNQGNAFRVLVVAQSSASITLQFSNIATLPSGGGGGTGGGTGGTGGGTGGTGGGTGGTGGGTGGTGGGTGGTGGGTGGTGG